VANPLQRDITSTDKTKLYAAGDKRALNAKRKPDDVAAPTDFSYMTTDGSSDAPYLKSR
jgi:hypothetical protein